MATIRSFIAIELPAAAHQVLAGLQSRLKDVTPPNTVRWTAPQNIHLTLHFLGNVAVADVEQISDIIEAAASAYPPFLLMLAGLGCFPHTRRPSIVWVGVSEETGTLNKLYRDLGDRLKRDIGFAPETRPYSPHLTIGRVKKGLAGSRLRQLGQVLEPEQAQVGQLLTVDVKEISLIKSDLKPDGPAYTPLSRGRLTGKE